MQSERLGIVHGGQCRLLPSHEAALQTPWQFMIFLIRDHPPSESTRVVCKVNNTSCSFDESVTLLMCLIECNGREHTFCFPGHICSRGEMAEYISVGFFQCCQVFDVNREPLGIVDMDHGKHSKHQLSQALYIHSEVRGSSFKTWSRSVYCHACYTYC